MKINRVTYIVLTIVYIGLLFYFSTRPELSSGGSAAMQIFNNIMHIPAYAGLVFLVLCCFRSKSLKMYIISFIFAILLGAFFEYLQSFVPGRYASMSDVLLNAIGVVVGMVVFRVQGIGIRG